MADARDQVVDHTDHKMDLLEIQNITILTRHQMRPEGSIKTHIIQEAIATNIDTDLADIREIFVNH